MSIHLWLSLQGPVYSHLENTVGEWNKHHQECRVELRNFAGDYDQAVKEVMQKPEEERPALVLAPEYLVGPLSERKVIPIYDFLNSEQLNKIADIVKRTFGNAAGHAVSLPFNPACGILYTNREALQAIGRSADYMPKTLEELEEVSRELIAKKVVPHGYTCAWPAAYLVEMPLALADLPMVQPDNGFQGYGEYQLSKYTDHFLRLRRQVREGIFVYASRYNDAKKPFVEERRVAFYMQGSSHAKGLKSEAKFPMGCGPIPTLMPDQKQKFALPLGGASIWVLNSLETHKMKQGVRDFLNYLASDDVQQKLHEELACVPVSKTLAPKLASFYQANPLHRAVVAQTVEAKLGMYSYGVHMPNYDHARKALFDLIEKILKIDAVSDSEVPALLKEFDSKFSIRKE